jgi:hypothetical protein
MQHMIGHRDALSGIYPVIVRDVNTSLTESDQRGRQMNVPEVREFNSSGGKQPQEYLAKLQEYLIMKKPVRKSFFLLLISSQLKDDQFRIM